MESLNSAMQPEQTLLGITDLGVIYSKHGSYFIILDNGSTALFTAHEHHMIKGSVNGLPKPIPVKTCASTTYATKVGLVPTCLAGALNSPEGISCLIQFYLVPDFFKHLVLIPQSLFETANWIVIGSKHTSFMFKPTEAVSRSRNIEMQSLSVPLVK